MSISYSFCQFCSEPADWIFRGGFATCARCADIFFSISQAFGVRWHGPAVLSELTLADEVDGWLRQRSRGAA